MTSSQHQCYVDLAGCYQRQSDHNSVGNVKTITDRRAWLTQTQTQTFAYNALDRVISATVSGGTGGAYTETYAYSAIGNLTGSNEGGASRTYAYTTTHAHAVGSLSNGYVYRYDADGNMTQRCLGAYVYNLSYDVEGRLVTVTQEATTTVFNYDGDGKRVQGSVAGITFTAVGGYYERTGATTIRKYYSFNGRVVAMRQNGTLSWLLADQLGSTSMALSLTGTVQSQQRYWPWGTARNVSGALPTDYRYTWQQEVSLIGLYDYDARWYDPDLKRFVQADTVVPQPGNPQTLNRYSYALNNPLKYIDPSGRAYEQSAGSVFDPNYWRDLLLWFVREANRNVRLPEVRSIRFLNAAGNSSPAGVASKADAFGMFIPLVKDSALWDFKDKTKAELGERIRLGGDWFEYSTPGNIHYGFVGAAAGFSLPELHAGAGVAQVRDLLVKGAPVGSWTSGFDTEDDYYAVEFGHQLYEGAYTQDRRLTVSEFTALLVKYEHRDKMARVTEPMWPGNPDPNWPYQPGYFCGKSRPWPSFLFPTFR